jgi:hypothetical protein
MWWKKFHRNDWLPQEKNIATNIKQKRRQVHTWAKETTTQETIDYNPTEKEIHETMKKMKLRSSPCDDQITLQMYLNAGPKVLKILCQIFTHIWTSEKIPKKLTIDILIPLYKRACKLLAANYRPISLTPVLTKILLNLLLNRLNIWNNTPQTTIAQSAYGGRKGRCRLQLLWTINAISITLLEKNIPHYISSQDINNAFPDTDPLLVDYLRYKQGGLTGKVWRLIHTARSQLQSKLNINGHTTNPKAHTTGINQGDPLSVDDFNVLTASIHKNIQKHNLAPTIKGQCFPGFSHVDDINITHNTPEQVQTWYNKRDTFVRTQRLQFKPEKDQLLKRGNPKTSTFSRPNLPPIKAQSNLHTLGEILTKHPHRSPQQVANTITKMKSKANRFYWLLWHTSHQTLEIVQNLFRAAIIPIATSALILTTTTPTEKIKIETTQAKFARHMLNVHQRASVIPTLALLGWQSTNAYVIESKLLFLGTLLRQKEAILTTHMVTLRLKTVIKGDRSGLLGELYPILHKYNKLSLLHTGPTTPKKQWKKQIKQIIQIHIQDEWQQWLTQHKHGPLIKKILPKWQKKSCLWHLQPSTRTLIANILLKTTNLQGDKIHNNTTHCRLCNTPNTKETSFHLITNCTTFTQQRNTVLLQLNIQNPNQPPDPPTIWAAILNNAIQKKHGLTYLQFIADTFITQTKEHFLHKYQNPIPGATDENIQIINSTAYWILQSD